MSLAAGKGHYAAYSTFQEARIKLMDIKPRLVVHDVDMVSLNPVAEVLTAVPCRSILAFGEVTFIPVIIKKLFIVPVLKVIDGIT